MGDAVAVLGRRSPGAAVVGLNDGTIVATLLAAAHPERLFAVIPGPPS